jgi:DNA-binding FrmR family transcriptional regulator
MLSCKCYLALDSILHRLTDLFSQSCTDTPQRRRQGVLSRLDKQVRSIAEFFNHPAVRESVSLSGEIYKQMGMSYGMVPARFLSRPHGILGNKKAPVFAELRFLLHKARYPVFSKIRYKASSLLLRSYPGGMVVIFIWEGTMAQSKRSSHKDHNHPSHPDAIVRMRRAKGHLEKVVRMIEGGEPCSDILQQLSAVISALSGCRVMLLQDHLMNCIKPALKPGNEALVKELDNTVKRALRT